MRSNLQLSLPTFTSQVKMTPGNIRNPPTSKPRLRKENTGVIKPEYQCVQQEEEEEEEAEEDHSAQDDDVSPGSRASTRQRRRRRRRQRPSLSQKAKEGLAQKLRFLSHLVYTLDTLVHAELCALYYMEYGIPPFLATKIQTRPAPLTLSLPLLSLAVS